MILTISFSFMIEVIIGIMSYISIRNGITIIWKSDYGQSH